MNPNLLFDRIRARPIQLVFDTGPCSASGIRKLRLKVSAGAVNTKYNAPDMLRALLAGPKRTQNRGYRRRTSRKVERTVERESAREDKTPQAQLASSVLAPFGRFCWWQGSRVKAGGHPRSSPPSAAASQMEL